MATTLDYLKAPEFTDDRLTEAINVPPYKTGRPAQLGIYVDTPIHTTYIRLGIEEDELTIIPARERGGESNLGMRSDKKGVSFDIPHFPLDDAILPSDIQNQIVFAPEYVLLGTQSVYEKKLEVLRGKHDLTHSYHDWGALNGVVLDGSGKVLVDINSKFGLPQYSVVYDLNTSSTDIAALNRSAKAHLRRELRGVAATGVRVLAGPAFFDKYVSHPYVLEAMRHYGGPTPNPARDEIEDTFTFAGLTLERIDEEYKFRQANGTLVTRKAVADNEAIMVPLGTPYFKRYIAPPDTLSGANRPPEPSTKIYVSTDDLPHDKGRSIHTESNVLPICIRPQVLTKLVMS